MSNADRIFETERLVLAPLVHKDFEALVKLDANRAVMKHITGRPRSREETIANIYKNYINTEIPPGMGAWSITWRDGDGPFLGLVMLKPLDGGPEIEVGYRLHPDHWGVGLATEAARRIVSYGFDDLKLETIVGVAMTDNAASQKVLQKCGLRPAGHVSAYGIDSLAYFALNREDYRAINARTGE
ncbi:hypothetical protein JCM17844_11590 [Iodidimonas gelatinilytica]|uniref:N-acetyltransferase domain-containing protein n=1 Tax=Iodidimonas gelatinilytica TaxID=1236966 RepID=A0A5A7N3H0_9PROT|nr:GNAT family N-acetyltransferase [Iodidimonas gelatinilytica]GEQ97522.1 hypothetical protein JCM17844_11590 [Iodidimonas gelatinilytica]GER01576.1 hypothetical protein JCM17845_21990 [Iodidimonas gelatinilytica]